MSAEPLRVGAYCRVSTSNQVLENDSSLDTQLHLIKERASYETKRAAQSPKDRPWKIAREYREEGVSGATKDRPALQRLLADVRAGNLDVVAVTKIDRFSRSLSDFFDMWAELEAHNVEFISLSDNLDTSSATGRAMLKIILVFAELERERTSERTKEKIAVRREQGLWFGGSVPLGLRTHPTNKTTLEHDAATGELARSIFRQYVSIGSARGLAGYLARNGIKRPVRKTAKGKTVGGGYFTVQVLIDMLSNPVYIAKRRLDDGRMITCAWEPLIDHELFDRVQVLLEQNSEKRPTGRESQRMYILEGLVRCQCGATMTRTTAKGKMGVTYFYYRCSTRHRTAGHGCEVKDVPADALEDFVLKELRAYSLNQSEIINAVTAANEGRDKALAEVEGQIVRVKTRQQENGKQLARLLDHLEATDEPDGALMNRFREKQTAEKALKLEQLDLETKRDMLRQEILDAATVVEGYRHLPRLLDAAKKKGSRDDLKAIAQQVIDVVEWKQDANDSKKGQASIRLFPLAELGVNQGGAEFYGLSRLAPTTGLEPVTR